MKKLQNLTSKIIGYIGVDAGIVWIGDPCYILHNEKGLPKSLGKTWSEFCDNLGENYTKSFEFDLGHEGLGVCSSTKHGDGVFKVIGFFEEKSERPSCIMIDFDNIF